MDNSEKSKLYFLFGCIVVRIILVIIALKLNDKYLPIMGYIGLILGLSFYIIYFFKLRETGFEVFGDVIWWNHLRLLHGTLYLIFSYLAITKNRNAYVPLLIDVTVGLLAFIDHRCIKH
jgi:hypothetical protein